MMAQLILSGSHQKGLWAVYTLKDSFGTSRADGAKRLLQVLEHTWRKGVLMGHEG